MNNEFSFFSKLIFNFFFSVEIITRNLFSIIITFFIFSLLKNKLTSKVSKIILHLGILLLQTFRIVPYTYRVFNKFEYPTVKTIAL